MAKCGSSPGDKSSNNFAAPKKRGRPRKGKAGHIPRPANSFMLFRSHTSKVLGFQGYQASAISKIIGEMWRNLSPEEQKPWERRAEIVKLEHALQYPGYQFKPKSRAMKERERQQDLEASEAMEGEGEKESMEKTLERGTKSPTPDMGFNLSPLDLQELSAPSTSSSNFSSGLLWSTNGGAFEDSATGTFASTSSGQSSVIQHHAGSYPPPVTAFNGVGAFDLGSQGATAHSATLTTVPTTNNHSQTSMAYPVPYVPGMVASRSQATRALNTCMPFVHESNQATLGPVDMGDGMHSLVDTGYPQVMSDGQSDLSHSLSMSGTHRAPNGLGLRNPPITDPYLKVSASNSWGLGGPQSSSEVSGAFGSNFMTYGGMNRVTLLEQSTHTTDVNSYYPAYSTSSDSMLGIDGMLQTTSLQPSAFPFARTTDPLMSSTPLRLHAGLRDTVNQTHLPVRPTPQTYQFLPAAFDDLSSTGDTLPHANGVTSDPPSEISNELSSPSLPPILSDFSAFVNDPVLSSFPLNFVDNQQGPLVTIEQAETQSELNVTGSNPCHPDIPLTAVQPPDSEMDNVSPEFVPTQDEPFDLEHERDYLNYFLNLDSW